VGLIDAEGAGAAGEREGFVEVLALDPVLELSGGIAGVGSGLEGRDDDGFDGPGLLGFRLAEGWSEQEEQAEEL
jgi:hypothetical protein